jgi:hypothetical protein
MTADVKASSISADVRVSTSGLAEATTVSGDIEARMGRAMTASGRRFSPRRMSGRIDNGGRELVLTTVSGTIELKKTN